MATDVQLSLPQKDEPLQVLTHPTFNRGVMTLIDESKLPPNALKQADNVFLVEDGAPQTRWGTAWYGNAPSANAIDGAEMFVDSTQKTHLVMIAGGVVYRSLDDGTTWTACSGATLTAGKKCWFDQGAGFLYIINGTDNMVRYNGTTILQTYTALTAPNVPTLAKTGLAGTSFTQSYRVSAVNTIGFTPGSTNATITVDRPRSQFNSTNYITITWTAVTGAVRYDLYTSDVTGQEIYIDSVSASDLSYIDNGSAPAQTQILFPSQNTTTGPVVNDISYIGERLWATGDANFPFRVWWSGAGPFTGYFATDYDGGYIDLQVGGRFRPMTVKDYRDGKGNPLATIWCNSPEGRGCVWQIALTTNTVQNIYSYTVPVAYKLPGSRGTPAKGSVINVLNDFMYYNSQAMYNLGSRAQFLNLLSTDEASANIRPTVRTINPSAASKIASYFFLTKVLFSVPLGSSSNNTIMVFDTERKCWLPTAFTYGVERFFEYADQNGNLHLLAWKPGDTQLSEIGENIVGDYGQPFTVTLTTGLYPVAKNRFAFMFVEEADVEFSNPQGTVNVSLIAIERSKGFVTVKSPQVKPHLTNAGWSTAAWSTSAWTNTTIVPLTYSESTIKRYFPVLKELNAYQFSITTSTLDAKFTLLTLQIQGSETNAGYPRQWRIGATTS